MIIVRTPLRVSFFGGGTDHPSWFGRPAPGAVLATSIDKFIYVQLRKLPAVFDFNYRVAWGMLEEVKSISEIQHPVVRAVLQHYGPDEQSGFEVIYNADLPSRSGLGSSSAFTVSMLHAFLGDHGKLCSKRFLAAEAIRVEQELLKETVGSQDQITAAYGGLNRIDFDPDGSFRVSPVRITHVRRAQLEARLVMFFTGFTRSASSVEVKKVENFSKREAQLRRMYELVGEGQAILEDDSRPLDDFGRLLHDSWMQKKSLAAEVSNEVVDQAYDAALKAGALGGKLLGAGGGGFLMVYAPPEKRQAVITALSSMVHVPIKMERDGTSVVLYAPELDDNYETSAARFV
ncbi:MAG: hypothetical protein NW206_10280 [Hyphomonadaceae bacterium]|nr:hypothetical protein [Hyphomonadaceae bacterium]